jgi:hypothetical protein
MKRRRLSGGNVGFIVEFVFIIIFGMCRATHELFDLFISLMLLRAAGADAALVPRQLRDEHPHVCPLPARTGSGLMTITSSRALRVF